VSICYGKRWMTINCCTTIWMKFLARIQTKRILTVNGLLPCWRRGQVVATQKLLCFTWCNIAPGRNTWNSTISTWCNIAPGSRSCHIQKLAKLSASLQQSQDGLSAKTQEAKSLRSELSEKEDTIKQSSSVDLDVRQETEITNTGQAYRSCHPLWYWYTVKVLLLIFVMMLVPPALYY
jgi:hypothetical protein